MKPINWQKFVPSPIIGVDEVGRGCLAGAVYAAAVILNEKEDYSRYTDSKTLSEKRREELSLHIKAHHKYCIAFATVEEITALNILNASLLAMRRAVEGLGVVAGHVLVDGNFKIKDLKGFAQTPIIKGDLLAAPIAAASIVAKVERDAVMKRLDQEFPNYGFANHKGYSTKDHKEAIAKFGPLDIHRSSFAGVKEHLRPLL